MNSFYSDGFDYIGLLRLWMKWMRRKRPESDVIPEQDKKEKA